MIQIRKKLIRTQRCPCILLLLNSFLILCLLDVLTLFYRLQNNYKGIRGVFRCYQCKNHPYHMDQQLLDFLFEFDIGKLGKIFYLSDYIFEEISSEPLACTVVFIWKSSTSSCSSPMSLTHYHRIPFEKKFGVNPDTDLIYPSKSATIQNYKNIIGFRFFQQELTTTIP